MNQFGFTVKDQALEHAISGHLKAIVPLREKYFRAARQYNDSLCKPLGSLGTLEVVRERLWAITKGEKRTFQESCHRFCRR